MAQALSLAERDRHIVAVISLDIDDFKQFNDTHGHVEGDRLLTEIARRTTEAVRESDTVTRLGGDEFLVLLCGLESIAQVETIVNRILQGVKRPLAVGNATISPALSMGIALYPRHGATPEALIARSDRALYAAKKVGKNRYEFADTRDAPQGAT
jgi:diguanylate cyclase (GGDEF)-like protein